VHIAKCVMVYFNLVYTVSSWSCVVPHCPGGESRDVNDDEQQLLCDARPFGVVAENRQRGRDRGFLPM
jgi:hypothetical protein